MVTIIADWNGSPVEPEQRERWIKKAEKALKQAPNEKDYLVMCGSSMVLVRRDSGFTGTFEVFDLNIIRHGYAIPESEPEAIEFWKEEKIDNYGPVTIIED